MYKHTEKGSSGLKSFFGIMFYYQDETKTNRRNSKSSFCLSRMVKRNLKNCNTSPQLSSNCTIRSDSHNNEICNFSLSFLLWKSTMHCLWFTRTNSLVHPLHTFVSCDALGPLEGGLMSCAATSGLLQRLLM